MQNVLAQKGFKNIQTLVKQSHHMYITICIVQRLKRENAQVCQILELEEYENRYLEGTTMRKRIN